MIFAVAAAERSAAGRKMQRHIVFHFHRADHEDAGRNQNRSALARMAWASIAARTAIVYGIWPPPSTPQSRMSYTRTPGLTEAVFFAGSAAVRGLAAGKPAPVEAAMVAVVSQ
jgi:hypothetical protein